MKEKKNCFWSLLMRLDGLRGHLASTCTMAASLVRMQSKNLLYIRNVHVRAYVYPSTRLPVYSPLAEVIFYALSSYCRMLCPSSAFVITFIY